ncbi:uncharacterized protein [Drosophila tropicalis]|uniref:uncharacterized protein LOC111519846 n=1 Tax=Drosophila willistoni TaxID=7260 RepID=UPI000C26D0A3|nr:uncharacterized protein LOC111519846 [Drosophila willistoni]
MEKSDIRMQRMSNEPKYYKSQSSYMYLRNKMLLKIENTLLRSHRQRETTGIKKLYNSFFVLF